LLQHYNYHPYTGAVLALLGGGGVPRFPETGDLTKKR